MHDAIPHHTFTTRALVNAARKAALGLFVLAWAFLSAGAYAQLPPAQHYGSIEYVTGGIGSDESTAFKQAMSHYPLALTFAQKLDGKAAYVSDVVVVIHDMHKNTVLNADANGPYFLVRLPAGAYEVYATYENKTLSRKVNVGQKGTAQAVFEWH